MKTEYKTRRLILRILTPDYAPCVLSFYQRNKKHLEPWEPMRPHAFYTLDFQRSNLSCEYRAFLKTEYLRYWIFLADDPTEPIGTISFSNILHGAFQSCMLGYKTDASHTQKGYMTEALLYLLPLVCREYHLHRIEAYVMPSNQPSIALLTRLSFQQEGLLHDFARIRDDWQDHLLYTYFAPTLVP